MGNGVLTGHLVSIIVPTYNAEKYIAAAITSVLAQTYTNFELLVVDDCSRDNSAQAVRYFTDKRITLIAHSSNGGPGAARNTALAQARGKYVTLLDADDEWAPNRLEILVLLAEAAGSEFFVADDHLVCFETPRGLRPFGTGSQLFHRVPYDADGRLELDLLQYLTLSAPMIKPLIPLDAIRQHELTYNIDRRYGEDLEFYCELFKAGLRLILIEPALYRLTPQSFSTQDRRWADLLHLYGRLLLRSDFSHEEKDVIRKHASTAKLEQRFAPVASALRKGNFIGLCKHVASDPRLVVEIVRRLPHALRHRLHAVAKGGVVR